MVPVEMSRRDIVEAVIVDPRQPVGPIGIGPDPGLERRLDLRQLLLGRLGVDDIEHAPLAVALLDDVEDLRHAAVRAHRRGARRHGGDRCPIRMVPAAIQPSWRASTVQEASSGMWWIVISASIVSLTKATTSAAGIQGAPRRAVMSEGRKIGRLDRLERRDIALEGGIERGSRLGGLELVADRRPRDRRRPSAMSRFAGSRKMASPSSSITASASRVQQLGDVVEIDMAALVQHDGEGIGRRGDDRRRGRRDHPLGEDRTGPAPCRSRGRSPRSRRPASNRDRRGRAAGSAGDASRAPRRSRRSSVVETTVVLIGPKARTKLDQAMRSLTCAGFQGRSSSWRLQDLAHRIADRDQLADDAGVLFGDAVGAAPLAHGDGDGVRRRPSASAPCSRDEVAALADRGSPATVAPTLAPVDVVAIEVDRLRLAVIDGFRKRRIAAVSAVVEIDAGMRQAGVGLAEGPRRERVRAEHEIGMPGEPAVHADRALIARRAGGPRRGRAR